MGHSCYLQQCPSCYLRYYQICTQNNFKISQRVALLRHQKYILADFSTGDVIGASYDLS